MGDSIKMNDKEIWYKSREYSNGSGCCKHRNELSGFIEIQEFPLSALQCLASNKILVLLIQAPSLEARSRTHTQYIEHMKYTKYNEEKKQCPA